MQISYNAGPVWNLLLAVRKTLYNESKVSTSLFKILHEGRGGCDLLTRTLFARSFFTYLHRSTDKVTLCPTVIWKLVDGGRWF